MKYMYIVFIISGRNFADIFRKGQIEHVLDKTDPDKAQQKIHTNKYELGGKYDEPVPIWGNYRKWI